MRLEDRILKEWIPYFGISPSSKRVIDDVMEKYGEKGRYYHNGSHLLAGLQELSRARNLPGIECLQDEENYMKMFVALVAHDAVYDPKGNDEENVRKSAELGKKISIKLGFDADFAKDVYGLVMTTTYKEKDEPKTRLQEIMQDIDLAILGKDEKTFLKYDGDIRKEYSFVPIDEYKTHRAAILQKFLDRKHIYGTTAFRKLYETKARENLSKAIEKLK
jgi:predicted metal-dependent HD superfamily phosphohydrolase